MNIMFQNPLSCPAKTRNLAVVILAIGALSVQSVNAGVATNHVFNVKSFGALGDGKTMDTMPIQSAIDAVGKAGGGVVLLPPGTYLSGSLVLKSHVELRIETNATLLGSTSHLDYKRLPQYAYALLLAEGCKDISLTGGGTIDGQGRALAKDVLENGSRLPLFEYAGMPSAARIKQEMEKNGGHPPSFESTLTAAGEGGRPDGTERPLLIIFRNCRHVKISGVSICNPSSLTENYMECSDLVIEGIKVNSTNYWNGDGIDVTDSRNVRISNCDVNSEDDGICLKSERGGKGCWDVNVSDCRIRSSSNAFKCGTGSFGGFHRIRARNLTIFDTFHSAIALESVDGGLLDDVVVEHVKATNTGNIIFLRLGNRNTSGPSSELENVVIRDVSAEVPAGKPDAAYGEVSGLPSSTPHNIIPSSIVGLPGHPVRNILLEDIKISYPGGGNRAIAQILLDALQSVPERPAKYPEFTMFGELPAWGFYIRHAEGIHFRNVCISFEQADFRPAMVIDDASGLKFIKTVVASASEKPVMALEQVHKASFDIQFPSGFEAVHINPDCEDIKGLPALTGSGN
jgi:parallel beta-helix repeat protein